MSIVRWGIIGCGDVVARKSGPAFQNVAGSRLVAVMRRSEESVRSYAREAGVPFWTTDADELIRHPEVDAIYMASPPDTHLDYALRIARAGKALIIEKPAGRSAAECRTIVEAFHERNVPLYVSYYRRFLPKFLKVKQILDSGELGRITSIQYCYKGANRSNNWRVDPRVSGGGMFWDLGCHVLDLLDFWFGPLQIDGGNASSRLKTHDGEDTVGMSFRTSDGACGVALWNFASRLEQETLEIEGRLGRISLRGIDPRSAITLDVFRNENEVDDRRNALQRIARRLTRKKSSRHEKFERSQLAFPRLDLVHEPMVRSIVEDLNGGRKDRGNGDAALRTATAMDAVLDQYYRGRKDDFWERSATWNSSWARAIWEAWRKASVRPGLELSEAQIRFFIENGYLGPFRCEAPELERLDVPERGSKLNMHRDDDRLRTVCSHASIVDRVAQLAGSAEVELFKTRFWVKQPAIGEPVPWHQDVADSNGGFHEDGSPVGTLTVWLSIDGANRENGAVRVVPGSHRRFFGEWKKAIKESLADPSWIRDAHVEEARFLELEAGEFYIFDSWLLHSSGPNVSPARRAALNMRFVAVEAAGPAAPGRATGPAHESSHAPARADDASLRPSAGTTAA